MQYVIRGSLAKEHYVHIVHTTESIFFADGPRTHSEGTVKEAAAEVGFFNDWVPSQLYVLWRGQVHRGIQNWNCFASAEAGTSW